MWTERLCDAMWLSCPSVSSGLGRNESPAAHNYGVNNPETFAIQGSGGWHELVVWECGMLAKPVYARQDRVMKVHNGTTEAPDS
jgi:hypothetical protein